VIAAPSMSRNSVSVMVVSARVMMVFFVLPGFMHNYKLRVMFFAFSGALVAQN